VDLHLIPGASPTPQERAAIDAAIGAAPPRSRHLLLPALNAAESAAGWVSEGALNYIAERLDVPPADGYGVATFYHLLSTSPRPATVVHVCDDVVCRTRGAEDVCGGLAARFGREGAAPADRPFMWTRSPCLGQCDHAPAALVRVAGSTPREGVVSGASADRIAAACREEAIGADSPVVVSMVDRGLLRRVGVVDPESLAGYRAAGGYEALRLAIAAGPDAIVAAVRESGLVGRGGAAFPTGRKWAAVAAAPPPRFLVCNADESEPGTFKDRVLMEGDPFAVIEAMTIAALACGCARGYIYIRGEYPRAAARLSHAVAEARRAGLLGPGILGSALAFDIEVRRGAGAYICGEETALFNSIEGLRGEPRNKPPFPAQAGLFGRPTVVNNVETLVNVPDIVRFGAAAFRANGTRESAGTRLFCLSGAVARPGVYEAPFGTTLRALVDRAGGTGGRALQAVLLGGAAGVFMAPHEIDLPLTIEDARAAGATLGSGAVVVFDDRADLRGIVGRIARFFRDESCGQCVPCRIGTVRQHEAIERLSAGAPLGGTVAELALIDDVALAMRDASICGLGHTASSAVQSAVRKLGVFLQERT
jgi:NADH-quinone oxidoreductase subunit F